MFDTVSANGTPAMGSYCWEDVIDGLNAVNAINPGFIWQFNYSMNWFEVNDYMSKNAPGEYIKVQTTTCQCTTGPCYCSPCWHNSSYANCREFGVTGNSGLGWVPGSVQQADWAPFESTTSTSVTWLPSTMSFIDVSVTDANGVNVTSWLQDLLLAVNAGTAYNISITTMYNATTSESVFTVDSVSAIATSSSGGDYYRIYLSWDSSSANANLLAHGVRICFYVSGTSPYGSMNHSGPNCIYSTIDLQLCIDSAAATPCCIPPPGFLLPMQAQFNKCSEVLGRHLLGDEGTPIKTSDVRYESFGNYSFGDCVYDPENKNYMCCTFDGQNDIKNKTIACKIINNKFVDDYGIWRSCERKPMLWDCVSSVNSCDNFKNTSEGYVGSFISMSQIDDYYESVEPTKNINNTHFDLLLSPIDLSLSKSDYGWCMSTTHKYTYEPKYNLRVTVSGTTGDGKETDPIKDAHPTEPIVTFPLCCIWFCSECGFIWGGGQWTPPAGTTGTAGVYANVAPNISYNTDNLPVTITEKTIPINIDIISETFDGLISWVSRTYPGIIVDNTMKFSKIKSVVTEYINLLPFCMTNVCSFEVSVGILPKPIQDHQVNCVCKQTPTGKYKSKAKCVSGNSPCAGQECVMNCTNVGSGDCYCDTLNTKKCKPIKSKGSTTELSYKVGYSSTSQKQVAPIGYHYMADGTLMSDAEHNTMYGSDQVAPIGYHYMADGTLMSDTEHNAMYGSDITHDNANYKFTNTDTGEVLGIDKNHELWPELTKAIDNGTPTQIKQLTQGQVLPTDPDPKGIFACCWLRGGCCSQRMRFTLYGITVEWATCCSNTNKGSCCPPEDYTYNDGTPIDGYGG